MTEFNGQILKSIGFPYKMLHIIDTYAGKLNLSRSDVVWQGMNEFIKNHKLEYLITKLEK